MRTEDLGLLDYKHPYWRSSEVLHVSVYKLVIYVLSVKWSVSSVKEPACSQSQ